MRETYLINVNIFFVNHNDIFDHKYCIDPGLLNMLKYQYLT